MKPETQDPLSTFVPPLFGDKSLQPSREGKVAGLKELLSGKPPGQPPDSLCRALGTQLSPVGMGKCKFGVCAEVETAVRLKGRGLPACLWFEGPLHLARPTGLIKRQL